MGSAGLRELMKFPEKYEITILARPSKINRKKLKEIKDKGVRIIWGDLLDVNAIRTGVVDSDIVLHVGGMVSPIAEHFPEKTLKVNIESMSLIAGMVKEIEEKNADRTIKVVYIGSVSQYGSKLPPNHWGKVGDPLKAAKFDAYALSKILAERKLVEAGLREWVSIRQTAILHPGLLKKANDPVTFHVPLSGAIEWISVEDSGRLLERLCRPDLPNSFWCNFYNAGGGEFYRLTNIDFERGILKAMGCPPPEKIFDTKWFATDNFHGIWFEDSDYLDEVLKFRQPDSFRETLDRMKRELPFYFRLAPLAPSFMIKRFMKKVAMTPGLGTLNWIKENNIERIRAAWGDKNKYNLIPSWEERKEQQLDPKTPPMKETKKKFATENFHHVVRCNHGHQYLTSEALERGGHGCPHCLRRNTGL